MHDGRIVQRSGCGWLRNRFGRRHGFDLVPGSVHELWFDTVGVYESCLLLKQRVLRARLLSLERSSASVTGTIASHIPVAAMAVMKISLLQVKCSWDSHGDSQGLGESVSKAECSDQYRIDVTARTDPYGHGND